jgi:uncharacterized protein with PQ loop repeat
MIVLLAALIGLVAGTLIGFIAVLALLKQLRCNNWIAILTAVFCSLPIGIVIGGLAGAGLISVMYPDFDWTR